MRIAVRMVKGSLDVKHDFVVEFVVADNSCPRRKTDLSHPQGFRLHVTEHSGLSVSWDNEMPPIYEMYPPERRGALGWMGTSEATGPSSPSSPPDYEMFGSREP
ncbi:hypothetical protein N7513_007257 [Penicillium frequentans]|nr:hypothetical protein N7513_007257 [Penicillium glabrum]